VVADVQRARTRSSSRLAAEAEEAGWHGVFVWDHLQWREPVIDVADPWITLAAIACATESAHRADGDAAGPSQARQGSQVDRNA
jgi:alkanesulfonate monooxygenase SsuD/methylene tetrahydromethanopterin reductase-like flavin-dependent oxidoreductase (luciferase family)